VSKTKKQKKEIVNYYVDKLNNSNTLFVITPTQITPNEANELRKKLKEAEATFNFIKNTLFKIALEKTKIQLKDVEFNSETAVIFCKNDASESAKIVYNFLKDIKKGEIKGGRLEDKTITVDMIEQLAQLPSKDILIATTVRTIAAPLSNFVNALNGNILNFVNVLKNISEK